MMHHVVVLIVLLVRALLLNIGTCPIRGHFFCNALADCTTATEADKNSTATANYSVKFVVPIIDTMQVETLPHNVSFGMIFTM
jgi:hypothetical protein